MNNRTLLTGLLGVSTAASAAAQTPAKVKAPQTRPNIIIIYTDDMGIGDLSCTNTGWIETPAIDRLASQGLVMNNYYSAAPVSSPSRVGLTTGMFPMEWGINTYLQARKGNAACEQADYLSADAPSMARILHDAGYATGHFGKWHMGGGRDVTDAPQITRYGFDEYCSTWESPDPAPELTAAISTPFVCDFGYDDAGRLIRQEWSAGYSSGWTTFDYTDGVVSGGTVCDDEGENSADGFERYFGDVKNDLLNIDPNALFMGGLLYDGTENYSDILGPLDRLALLRLAGRGSDRYVVRYDGGDESVSGDEMGSWPEPNVTVHQSSEYCEYEWDETLRYAFNDDGSIATVSQEELCTRIRYEYDIVVGDELVNPDYPEGGYKCTIANETRTPVGKGTNTYIYTFTYR